MTEDLIIATVHQVTGFPHLWTWSITTYRADGGFSACGGNDFAFKWDAQAALDRHLDKPGSLAKKGKEQK